MNISSGSFLGSFLGVRIRRLVALTFALLACIVAQTAMAADCPGHPVALGTSRTLVVDPREHPRLGIMQYSETLPLADHEVVLTFDDGPLPRNSNQVLEILASQCVKATFFTIGSMAQSSPEGVRKLRDAGHTIGTHTQDHPLSMNRMSIERARQEIDEGIASVKAALGADADTALAPFFRIPGLLRADIVEDYLAAQGIQIWSADFLADDWRHISSSRVYDLTMKRLEGQGKRHSIASRHPGANRRCIAKDTESIEGARLSHRHVVPATAERPATLTEPEQWRSHPENVAIAQWPKIPHFIFADAGALPAPSLSDFDLLDAQPIALAGPFDRSRSPAQGVAPPRETPWPQHSELPLEEAAATLPAPARSLFDMPDGLQVIPHSATSSRHAEQAGSSEHETHTKVVSANTGGSRHLTRGKRLGRGLGRHRHHGASRVARGTPPTAIGHRGPPKHLVQVKKKNV